MQRVAGSLFAKMRDMHQGLTSTQLDVIIIRNVVDQITTKFDTGLRLFDGLNNHMSLRFDQMSVQLDNSFLHMTHQLCTSFLGMTTQLNNNSLDMTNRFNQVALQLERLTQQLDEQSVSNQRWFIVTVGLNIVIYLCMVFTAGALGYLSLRIPKHCNATNATVDELNDEIVNRRPLESKFTFFFCFGKLITAPNLVCQCI